MYNILLCEERLGMYSIPKNKIIVISALSNDEESQENINKKYNIIKTLRLDRKRDWFTSYFYKCLPISIGNIQGLVVSLPFEINILWNGSNEPSGVIFDISEKNKEIMFNSGISILSHFGHGIFSISLPFIIKTPEGVNIMTISPPNFPTYGISPLCSVVETDNLKYTFALSIKINTQNTWIKILPNYPVVGLLPIPRFFCDQFEIIDDSKFLDKNFINEQKQIAKEHEVVRNFLSTFKNRNQNLDRTYFTGTDIRGNKFVKHQINRNGSLIDE